MKIIVFGPTGGVGRQLMRQAIAAGHELTAFVRDPRALVAAPGLRVIAGDVLDAASVDEAIVGHDAVLSALGGRPWRSLPICSSAIGVLAPAMMRHGIRRLVCISTFGAGDTRPQVGWFGERVVFGLILRNEVADKEAMERALLATQLDWVVVRVGRLTNGPATGSWRAADDGSIRGMGKISRADVAAFMLAQLQRDEWVRRKPVLQY